MAADTSVKWLSNTMTGAPAINGLAGSLITVLDAVLVNGFNTQTVDSIVVSGGIATVTRAAGSLPSVRGTVGAQVGTVVKIAGATPAGLNGEKRILTTGYVGGTSFQFDANGIPDQTATGTITCTTAGLGWTKYTVGTNKVIYQRIDVNSTGSILYVNDTAGTTGLVYLFEVSNQSLFTSDGGYFNGAGGYWPKSSTADSTARAWTIIGDSRGFFIQTQYQASNSNIISHLCFGDIAPVKQNDPYSCFLRAWDSSAYVSNTTKVMQITPVGQEYNDLFCSASIPGLAVGISHLQRNSIGYGNVSQVRNVWMTPAMFVTNQGYMYNYSGATGAAGTVFLPTTLNVPMAPNAADNGLYLVPQTLIETGGNVYRGTIAGLYSIPQWVGTGYFSNDQTFMGTGTSTGRVIVLRQCGSGTTYGSQTYFGQLAYDVSGPWVR